MIQKNDSNKKRLVVLEDEVVQNYSYLVNIDNVTFIKLDEDNKSDMEIHFTDGTSLVAEDSNGDLWSIFFDALT